VRRGIYVLPKYDMCSCETLRVAVSSSSSVFQFKLWQLEDRPTRDLFPAAVTCQVYSVKSSLKHMKLRSPTNFLDEPKMMTLNIL
jgi:hypothetical protein